MGGGGECVVVFACDDINVALNYHVEVVVCKIVNRGNAGGMLVVLFLDTATAGSNVHEGGREGG